MRITVLLVVAQLSKGLTPAVVGLKYGVEAKAMDASFFEGDVSVYFAGKTDWLLARRAISKGRFEDGLPVFHAI